MGSIPVAVTISQALLGFYFTCQSEHVSWNCVYIPDVAFYLILTLFKNSEGVIPSCFLKN
jgi:hypothetical protein